jgi:hypothetical protein
MTKDRLVAPQNPSVRPPLLPALTMPSGEPLFSLRARDYLGYPGLNSMAGFAARTTAQVLKIGDLVRVPNRSGSVTLGASFHLGFGAGSL